MSENNQPLDEDKEFMRLAYLISMRIRERMASEHRIRNAKYLLGLDRHVIGRVLVGLN